MEVLEQVVQSGLLDLGEVELCAFPALSGIAFFLREVVVVEALVGHDLA